MAWPPQFLDELIDRTDLVDLVGESVRLTKKATATGAAAPFTVKKTPSFHVVPDRKIYKCFGCGKGGGAINFVMELDNLSFREAVEVLAKRCGMQVPDSGASPAPRSGGKSCLPSTSRPPVPSTAGCTPRKALRVWRISKSAGYPKGP